MKRLHYHLPNDLSKLHDELLEAIPALRPADGEPAMLVESDVEDTDNVWLSVPAGADEDAIRAVVEAHDPTPGPARLTPLERLAEAVEGANSLADMKQAIADFVRDYEGT